jgi:hypothetical protein
MQCRENEICVCVWLYVVFDANVNHPVIKNEKGE